MISKTKGAGFQVKATRPGWRALCDGNSLTAGQGGTPYPEQLAPLIGGITVVNKGIGAATTQSLTAAFATNGETGIKGEWKRAIAILWEVTNAIWFGQVTTPQEALSQVATWAALYRAYDAKIVVPNVIARGTFSAAQESLRLGFNSLLATEWPTVADATVDLATTFHDPTDPVLYSDTETYQTHLTTVGYGEVATLLSTPVLALMT